MVDRLVRETRRIREPLDRGGHLIDLRSVLEEGGHRDAELILRPGSLDHGATHRVDAVSGRTEHCCRETTRDLRPRQRSAETHHS